MPLASEVVLRLMALPYRSVPLRVRVTPAMRGSTLAACGTPPLPVLRSRSSKTVPLIDAACTWVGAVPVLLLLSMSMEVAVPLPSTPGETVAVLVWSTP